MVDQWFRTTLRARGLGGQKMTVYVSYEALCSTFLRKLRAEGKSEGTISRYQLVYKQYGAAAGALGCPWSPTGEHITDYPSREREAGKAKNTIRNSYLALRSFFNWAVEEGEVSAHPLVRIKIPALDLASPDAYTGRRVSCLFPMCTATHGQHGPCLVVRPRRPHSRGSAA